jgi:hypothetical protein
VNTVRARAGNLPGRVVGNQVVSLAPIGCPWLALGVPWRCTAGPPSRDCRTKIFCAPALHLAHSSRIEKLSGPASGRSARTKRAAASLFAGKANDEVIRVAHQESSALEARLYDLCEPHVQHVVQVDVGQQHSELHSRQSSSSGTVRDRLRLKGPGDDLAKRFLAGHYHSGVLRRCGFHAFLEPLEAGKLGGEADDDRQSVPACGPEDRRLVPIEPSPAACGATPVVVAEAAWSLPVLRGHRQPGRLAAVPECGALSVAEVAFQAASERAVELGAFVCVLAVPSASGTLRLGRASRSEPVT